MPLIQPETKILQAIRENTNFRLSFSQKAETIADKIYSFNANPNCSCKGAIIKWINENTSVTNELLTSYQDYFNTMTLNPTVLKTTPNTTTAKTIATNLASNSAPQKQILKTNPKMGHVEIIENTPEAYAELFKKINMERWMFRGINIIEKKIDNKDVWVVLFY